MIEDGCEASGERHNDVEELREVGGRSRWPVERLFDPESTSADNSTKRLVGVAAWQNRQHAGEDTQPTSLAITGEGSPLVVESQDGRRLRKEFDVRRRAGGFAQPAPR
jgi:hypothetical protein